MLVLISTPLSDRMRVMSTGLIEAHMYPKQTSIYVVSVISESDYIPLIPARSRSTTMVRVDMRKACV